MAPKRPSPRGLTDIWPVLSVYRYLGLFPAKVDRATGTVLEPLKPVLAWLIFLSWTGLLWTLQFTTNLAIWLSSG